MAKRKLMILTLFLLTLLAITAVSANDDVAGDVVKSDMNDSMPQLNEISDLSEESTDDEIIYGLENEILEPQNDDLEVKNENNILKSSDDDVVSMDEDIWFFDRVAWYGGDYNDVVYVNINFVDNLENPNNITLELVDDDGYAISDADLAFLNDQDNKITKLTTDCDGIAVYDIPFDVDKFSFCVGFWYNETHVCNYMNICDTILCSFNFDTWFKMDDFNGTDLNDTSGGDFNGTDLNDTSGNGDLNDGTGENDDNIDNSSFTALENKINGASDGSTLYLDNDYCYNEEYDTGRIYITKQLTIDGNGHTIDALSKSGIFNISVDNVVLRNIKFINGASGDGGAVEGGVSINCTFINNSVTASSIFRDHRLVLGGYGGAISHGNAINSTFINNSASTVQLFNYSILIGCFGGAMVGDAVNCTFINNSVSTPYMFNSSLVSGFYGGAIMGNAVNCVFINNSAYEGGAIMGNAVNCVFINNSAYASYDEEDDCYFGGYGGAVSNANDVINCTFQNNCAYFFGGAIFNVNHVENCRFYDNHAGSNGGAIYSDDDDYNRSVDNCLFVDNYAVNGGAIYSDYYENSLCYINNCSFVNNSALSYYEEKEDDCIYEGGYGGAVYGGCAENCNFTGNSARAGGAVSEGSAVNCIFTGNFAFNGGAMAFGDAENCIFDNNSAYLCGCAILDCSAVNCVFANNSYHTGCNVITLNPLNYLLPEKVIDYTIPPGGISIDFSQPIQYEDYSSVFAISGCDIQEDALNNYGCVELIGDDLVLKSLDLDNYTIGAYISGELYLPYSYEADGFGYYDVRFDLSDVRVGNHDVHIIVYGNSKLDFMRRISYRSVVEVIIPIAISSRISISSSNVTKYYGGDEKYTVNLMDGNNPAVGENVQITVNGKTSTTRTDSNGQASIDLDLPAGEYNVTAVYGDISTTSKVTVKSTLITNDATGTYLNSKVSATFLNTTGNDIANANVTFKVNGKEYSATTNNRGVATANIDLDVGNYTVTAVNPLSNEQNEFNLIISKSDSQIELTYNQNDDVTILTATLTPTSAKGSVIFNINGENKSVVINEGKATLTLTDLKAGDYEVTVFYKGDNNLNASQSNTVSFVIEKKNQDNSSGSSDNDSPVSNVTDNTTGKNNSSESNVTNQTGGNVPDINPTGDVIPYVIVPPLDKDTVVVELPSDATGTVTLTVDGKDYVFAVVNGKADVKLPDLGEGNHPYEIKYSGDSKYAPSSNLGVAEIKKTIGTVIVMESKFSRYATDYGAGERGGFFYATLYDVNGIPLAGKTVQITVNGVIYDVITDNGGKAGLAVNLAVANSYTYALLFCGDDDYNASLIASSKLSVIKKPTGIIANNMVFKTKAKTKTVTVALNTIKNPYDGKMYLKKGKIITLSVAGKTYSAKTDKKGIAKFNININKNGKYTATINFEGDSTYDASSKKITITVSKAGGKNKALSGIGVGMTPANPDAGGSLNVVGDYSKYLANENVSTSNNNKDKINVVIDVEKTFTRVATDYGAGERGAFFYATLKDASGKPIAGKTIQIAVNGPIYKVVTDNGGKAGLQVNLAAANTYTYALSFSGDGTYNPAKLASSKLTVTKKPTSITAKNMAFKASAKTKTVTVSLKTSKNPYDAKTYLKQGKKLTLKVNGKTFAANTNKKCEAKFNIKLNKKGKFNALISFSGDNTYNACSKSIKLTIK